jgi:HK97 family phage prohead protease
MSNKIKETTELMSELSDTRILAIDKSQRRWFRFECDKLLREKTLIQRELDKEPERNDLRVALKQNDDALIDLHDRWHNRTFLSGNTEQVNIESPETRLIAPAAKNFQIESRASNNNSVGTIYGIVSPYNKPSLDLGGFIEYVQRGAWAKVLADKNRDVRSCFNHSADYLLGLESAGTMKLRDSTEGLFFECILGNNAISQYVFDNVKRRNIQGCSVMFYISKDYWILEKGKTDVRVITEVAELNEAGCVSWPAFPSTSVFIAQERAANSSYDIDDDEEYDKFVKAMQENERQKKIEIERKYRYAGRILGRCRSALKN